MNKKSITKLFNDEAERVKKTLSIIEQLDIHKVYKIECLVYTRSGYGPNGDYLGDVQSKVTFIGKLKTFNKGTIKFYALGIQKITGNYFQYEVRKTASSKGLEVPVYYTHIESIEEWKNLDTPQKEAPFLVNYEFMSQEFKKLCFNT